MGNENFIELIDGTLCKKIEGKFGICIIGSLCCDRIFFLEIMRERNKGKKKFTKVDDGD